MTTKEKLLRRIGRIEELAALATQGSWSRNHSAVVAYPPEGGVLLVALADSYSLQKSGFSFPIEALKDAANTRYIVATNPKALRELFVLVKQVLEEDNNVRP